MGVIMSGEKNGPTYVTKTFLPPLEEYTKYLNEIWESGQVTNNGPLSKEFESQASGYLGIDSNRFRFVSNGTIALQLALRALDITEGEVITTPFTYVATTSAILWEHCTPVFVDIDRETLNLDPEKIEAAITGKTKAIMPVHVFGNPCDMTKIEHIAKEHGLKVIYDAAHAFGVEYGGKALLDCGDISTCSFHATKPFHTIEGGCVVSKETAVSEKVELMKRFGHNGDEHYILGINGKASEFQAAMGLVNLRYIDGIISRRKAVSELYSSLLVGKVTRPKIQEGTRYNYAYYPVILNDEDELKRIIEKLRAKNIFPRRYFYPSLTTLPYVKNTASCPVAEDIANRIACLPLYDSLGSDTVEEICEVIVNG